MKKWKQKELYLKLKKQFEQMPKQVYENYGK